MSKDREGIEVEPGVYLEPYRPTYVIVSEHEGAIDGFDTLAEAKQWQLANGRRADTKILKI